MSTPIDETSCLSDVSERVKSYGIPTRTIDGNNVIKVYTVTRQAVERARANLGPTFIECKTYRYKGHSRSDPAIYRSQEELNSWLKKDPLPRLRDYLVRKKTTDEAKLREIENEVGLNIDRALTFARKSPQVNPREIVNYVFA